MSSIDYSGWLKMTEDFARHANIREVDPDPFKPLDRPPKKPAPHPCRAIRVYGAKDRPNAVRTQESFFEPVTIPQKDRVFMSGKSFISPVSQKIGIPLVIYLEDPLAHPLNSWDRSDYENQTITYLLINLKSGFASLEHQDGLGTALVARLDYQPLSIGLLTTIHAYTSMLLSERYGSEDDTLVQNTITPDDFAKFARKFIAKTKKNFEKAWDIKY